MKSIIVIIQILLKRQAQNGCHVFKQVTEFLMSDASWARNTLLLIIGASDFHNELHSKEFVICYAHGVKMYLCGCKKLWTL
jgi:hypothetical protein